MKQHTGSDANVQQLHALLTMSRELMLVGVPTRHAMAVLAAGWAGDAPPEAWEARRQLLGTILELSVATLGRIPARHSLEDLVSTQYAQMAGTAHAHAEELARHKDAGCAVIYADIDGLKLVNDQLGHATGDPLIRDAAKVLRESLRDTDVLARFGGDAFVAFALDNAHPRVILARVRENLHAFNLMQERSYRLAISAGAVRCDPGNGTPLVDYVQLADREMFLHKQRSLH